MNNLLQHLQTLLGPQGILTAETDKQPFLKEWRGRITGKSAAVLLPKTTAEVAEIVKRCAAQRVALVPQGGNTGLVGASVPDAGGAALCLSLKRMNAIRRMDAADFSMTVEAGCVLATAQDATKENRMIGMTLASEGSVSIGGLIATNAGGSLTLRYGNMREQVLGLEAVLADGSIWNGLRSLRKNNSGYDLKQLLIGSEGTLGIITAATLKLYPQPEKREAALLAFNDPAEALTALAALRGHTADALAVFELIPAIAVTAAVKYIPGTPAPFAETYPWYALIETHGGPPLENVLEKIPFLNAALARSEKDARAFWHLREVIVEAQKHLGASLKHDIAVPVSAISAFLQQGETLVQQHIPGARLYSFGHAGDGNIHFNISRPENMEDSAFTAKRESMAQLIHDLALSLGGSLSAEHGIGRFKRDEFHRTVSPTEINAMRRIKQALDPLNILNPGVIF
jgi:FAD/FMN-containing dehydrogenase